MQSIMLLRASFVCAYCSQPNETSVDPSQGAAQSYVEDCQVCCRPLVLHVTTDGVGATIEASREAD